MRSYTDSQIVEYNDDGSRTETTVVTYQPTTPTQKAAAFVGLGLLLTAPVLPLVAIAAYEKFEEKLADRKERKLAKKSK